MIPFRISSAGARLASLFLAAIGAMGAGGQVLVEVPPAGVSIRPPEPVGVALSARIAAGPFADAADPALQPIINEVRRWPTEPWASTVGGTVDFSELAAPKQAGRLVALAGVIRQVSNLQDSGSEPLREWAIEITGGQIAIAVTTEVSTDFMVGTRVRFLGRYAGQIESRSRDGRTRSWPLVIGRAHRVPSEGGWIGLPIFILLLGGTVVFLRRRAAVIGDQSSMIREDGSSLAGVGTGVEVVAEPMSLPSDPADALEELAKQTGSEPGGPPTEDSR